MIESPLLLESYFFTKISLDAIPSEAASEGKVLPVTHCEFLQHKETSEKWMVMLDVSNTDDDSETRSGYRYKLSLVGLFMVQDAYPKDKSEAMVRANAPAVLYGAAREMLLNITSRGPFLPIKLPTVAFIDEGVPKRKETSKNGR